MHEGVQVFDEGVQGWPVGRFEQECNDEWSECARHAAWSQCDGQQEDERVNLE